jgi:ElaB/YqjD/DUF883 family membrane-anchored ribosome-binding protein
MKTLKTYIDRATHWVIDNPFKSIFIFGFFIGFILGGILM